MRLSVRAALAAVTIGAGLVPAAAATKCVRGQREELGVIAGQPSSARSPYPSPRASGRHLAWPNNCPA